MQVTHPVTKVAYKFWLSDPHVGKPIKEDAPATADNRLFPWECREAVRGCVALQMLAMLVDAA